MEWIPKVQLSDKNKVEKTVQDEGFSNFKFIEIVNEKKMIPVQEREFYYPVLYMEPMVGNESVFGFDLASDKSRKKLLTLQEKQIPR